MSWDEIEVEHQYEDGFRPKEILVAVSVVLTVLAYPFGVCFLLKALGHL